MTETEEKSKRSYINEYMTTCEQCKEGKYCKRKVITTSLGKKFTAMLCWDCREHMNKLNKRIYYFKNRQKILRRAKEWYKNNSKLANKKKMIRYYDNRIKILADLKRYRKKKKLEEKRKQKEAEMSWRDQDIDDILS